MEETKLYTQSDMDKLKAEMVINVEDLKQVHTNVLAKKHSETEQRINETEQHYLQLLEEKEIECAKLRRAIVEMAKRM